MSTRAHSQSEPKEGSPRAFGLTPAEERLLAVVERDGEAWFIPKEGRMVKRLADERRLTIAPESRYNELRDSWERRVTRCLGA